MFFELDIYYVILVLPAVLFAVYALFKVRWIFKRYDMNGSVNKLTGADLAREILYIRRIYDVTVEPLSGHLTDHYDARTRTLKLSQNVYYSSSVAALGVAAHEAGHAIQHRAGYKPFVLQSILIPIAGIGSAAGPVMAVSGLLFGWPLITQAGIIVFAAAMAFYLITLPVEYDASRRAVDIVNTYGVMNWSEIEKIKKVLDAASMTYVASAIIAAANLLRLTLLAKGMIRK